MKLEMSITESSDVERGVSFPRSSVDARSSLEELLDNIDVPILGGQMECVESIGITSIYVNVSLEVLQDFFEVPCTSRTEEARSGLRLEQQQNTKSVGLELESKESNYPLSMSRTSRKIHSSWGECLLNYRK